MCPDSNAEPDLEEVGRKKFGIRCELLILVSMKQLARSSLLPFKHEQAYTLCTTREVCSREASERCRARPDNYFYFLEAPIAASKLLGEEMLQGKA